MKMQFPCDTCKHNMVCYGEDYRLVATGYPGYEHLIIGVCRWCPLELSASGDFEEGRKAESELLDRINRPHVDDLMPKEQIPPEAWTEPDPNEVITTRFHIDEWPVT